MPNKRNWISIFVHVRNERFTYLSLYLFIPFKSHTTQQTLVTSFYNLIVIDNSGCMFQHYRSKATCLSCLITGDSTLQRGMDNCIACCVVKSAFQQQIERLHMIVFFRDMQTFTLIVQLDNLRKFLRCPHTQFNASCVV